MILKVREASGWVLVDNLSEVRIFDHGFSEKYLQESVGGTLIFRSPRGCEHFGFVTAYRATGPDSSVCELFGFNDDAYILNDRGDTVECITVRKLYPIVDSLEELDEVLGGQDITPGMAIRSRWRLKWRG